MLEASGITIAAATGKPGPRQLDGIQVLRGVAASVVVFHHYCLALLLYHRHSRIAEFRKLAWVGASGVDIFFCISGFVIIYSLLARSAEIGWGAFLLARVKRIIPLYWLFTLVIVAIWASGRFLRGMTVTPAYLIRSLLLLPNYLPDGRAVHPILGQGWTLQYEALFYALCAVVIVLAGSRRVFPWTPLAVGVCAGLSLAVPGAPAYLHDPLLLEFVGGTALGWLAATGRLTRLPARRLLAWLAIGVGTIALLLTALLPDPEPYRALVWGVPGMMIVFGCILVTPTRGHRVTDVLMFLGAASYSVYLGHAFLTLFVSALLKNGIAAGAGDLFLFIATVATIALTALLYPLVERPITRWLR